MDSSLMHWRAWGLYAQFASKFGAPIVPENVTPAQLARLMQRSILSGDVAPPLTLKPPIIRVSYVPGGFKR